MKKISIAIIGLLSFSLLSGTVSATSGACSYHGGVNCSSGPNYNGNVICNDGFVNSSVLFSDTDECKVSVVQCNYPSQPFCSLSAIQQEQKNAIGGSVAAQAAHGLLGSTFGSAQIDVINNSYSLEYSYCQSQWAAYQANLNSYNVCIQNQNSILDQQAQSGAAQVQMKFDNFCIGYNGTGSVWSASLPADTMGAQCTQSTDQIFQKYFKLAMDSLPPQYQSIVDPNIIKALSLNPANGNKTFPQIITETYPNVLNQTSTPTSSLFVVSSTLSSGTSNVNPSPVSSVPISILTLNQNLRVGTSGNDVISLQKFLENKGFLTLPAGTTEGYFGNLTKQALVSFQTSVGLPNTGYCGPLTRAIINGS
jgi:Putative peptidoglycan binding domain